MIEVIKNMPLHILGFIASGQVTASDYETVLIPAVESRLADNEKVRLFYHIGPAFTEFTSGAIWDDAKLGFGHLKAWEKIAVVTDVDWVKSSIGFFKFAMPCPLKVFSNAQYS